MKEILEKFEKAISKSLDEMAEPRGLSRPSANDICTMAKAIKLLEDLKKSNQTDGDVLSSQDQKIVNVFVDTSHLSFRNAEKLKKEVSEEIRRIMNVIHSDNPAKSVHTADILTERH